MDTEQRYLDLLKDALMGSGQRRGPQRPASRSRIGALAGRYLGPLLQEVLARLPADPEADHEGRGWPVAADTMIGRPRLDNVEHCVRQVVADDVPGDLIETGVWRGGTTIFMRALLDVLGDTTRRVWVADSFEGLPRPDAARYPHDRGSKYWMAKQLAVSVDDVKASFARYGLLDDRVRFLQGWFKDTLASAPIEQLAVLRLDGDLYESTMDALEPLYPKLSTGGFAIIDDYGAVEGCRAAVEDYRARHDITEPIERIDWTGVYWRKED
jgi:O-methyltransferase